MSQRTPNVPKSRDSFFHRKYRDISNCPPTPATPKVTANQYHHFKSGTASSKLINTTPTTSSSTHRRSNKKLKRDQNESITSDYSTPRTIRTPTTGKLRGKQRVTHLIYRPLELDTESSSESTENNFRRRKLVPTTPNSLKTKSITKKIPLAIEAPSCESSKPNLVTFGDGGPIKATPDDSCKDVNGSQMVKGSAVAKLTTTTPIYGSSDITHHEEDTIVEPQLVKATHEDSMDEDEVQVIGFKPATSATNKITIDKVAPTSLSTETIPTSKTNKVPSSTLASVGSESVMSNSEPPTPPITPEKVKEGTSTFVPGNIWIFNSTQERSSVLSSQTT